MTSNLPNDWKSILNNEFNNPYFKKLEAFILTEYKNNTCYPNLSEVFNAFNYCTFDDLKVVIIGQDPYHGKGQANGLCFSVNKNTPFPPSLNNIFKELNNDIEYQTPQHGDLTHWAKQGVLLLNATLTVREGQAGSHQKQGWETFTDTVITTISTQKQDVIFLLWGGFAKKKVKLINKNKHHILTSGHPSPLSANRGYWFNNKHFSKTNTLLKSLNKVPINW